MSDNARAFGNELSRQSHCYEQLGILSHVGFDPGMWWGGLVGHFAYNGAMDAVSMGNWDYKQPGDHIPFLLVLGESVISAPQLLHLLNGAKWNGGGKPDVIRTPFGRGHRMWLAIDVNIHRHDQYAKRRTLSPNDPDYVAREDDPINVVADIHEVDMGVRSSKLDMSDYATAQLLKHAGLGMATICEGLALASCFPDVLKKHGAVGLYGSQYEDHTAPFIHARATEVHRNLPQDKPNLFGHSVGTNCYHAGSLSIMTVGSVFALTR